MKTIRASSVPLLLACPASFHAPGERIDPDNEAARLGTALHQAVESLPQIDDIEWDTFEDLAAEHRVPVGELRALAGQARKLWRMSPAGWLCTIRDVFRDALPEGSASMQLGADVTLTGTVDLRADTDLLDWKTGRVDRDYVPQMAAYALLASRGSTSDATAILAWVRTFEIEYRRFPRVQLEHWHQRIYDAAASWDGTYRPGDHCEHCPLAATCTARTAMVRADIGVVLESDAQAFAALTPTAQVEIVAKARSVARLADRLLKAARQHVIEHGPVVAESSQLVVTETTRRSVDTAKAMPVLRDALPVERLADAIDVRLAAAKKLAREYAPRGEKKNAAAALVDALDAAGAITTTSSHRLEIRRVDP